MDDPFTYNPVPLVPYKRVRVRYIMQENKSDIDSLIDDVLAKHEAGPRSVEQIVMADDFRARLRDRADALNPNPLWHGWAIVEAWLAGYSRGFDASPVLAEELKRCRETLEQLSECDLNDRNCDSLETASKRIRAIARTAIAPKEPDHADH